MNPGQKASGHESNDEMKGVGNKGARREVKKMKNLYDKGIHGQSKHVPK